MLVMNTPVFIDSNVWNFLFERSINIDTELPGDEFVIFCSQEVFIELGSIPNTGKDGKSKRGLKAYIQKYMGSRVNISADFGFYEAGPCFAGFDQGTFQSEESRSYYERPETHKMILNKSVRKETGLGKIQPAYASVSLRLEWGLGPPCCGSINGRNSCSRLKA